MQARLRPLAHQPLIQECTWCGHKGATRFYAVFLDQYGLSTRDELCLVQAVRSYVAVSGESPGAFFRSLNGCPLSKARFVDLVRSALARAGVPIAGYSGHSFRIGAATAASQAGIPDLAIQALGRWSSPAFLRYIRVPREHLAQYSNPLANAWTVANTRS
jgi:integrase